LWLKHITAMNTTDNIGVLMAFILLFCVQHNGMINLNNSFIKLLTVIHNRFSSCSMLPCATSATNTSLY